MVQKHFVFPNIPGSLVDLSKIEITDDIKSVLPSNYINMNFVAPFKVEGKNLHIAISDSSKLGLMRNLKAITKKNNNHIKIEAWKLMQKIIEKYAIFDPKWEPKIDPKIDARIDAKNDDFLDPQEIRPWRRSDRTGHHPPPAPPPLRAMTMKQIGRAHV